MTAACPPPGASASMACTRGLPGSPSASRSAVCRHRTSGLVKMMSISTPKAAMPATHLRNFAAPSGVSGRTVSSGHSLPRSAATAWRTR